MMFIEQTKAAHGEPLRTQPRRELCGLPMKWRRFLISDHDGHCRARIVLPHHRRKSGSLLVSDAHQRHEEGRPQGLKIVEAAQQQCCADV